MNTVVASFVSGFVFALGLGISGMTQPAKVTAFLDFAGDWDPSLACVMIGAILVHAILYQLIRRRPSPLFAATFSVPTQADIDPRLIAGAALFGIGWGLGGFCPGPAVTSLASGHASVVIFVIAMVAGMSLYKLTEGRWLRQASAPQHHTASPVAMSPASAWQSPQDF
ncbi:MAG TPA: YeeE/YedE family protein [Candidatus Binatia bacterium]|jgi:hypothetical protein|nr:YeeE/YedE family protein [Candidatus Binatia bacterium]